jgi:hypothetical protein
MKGGMFTSTWANKDLAHLLCQPQGSPPQGLRGQAPRLLSEGVYGVAWSGRVRVRKVSNAQRVRETRGREEWIGVPIDLTGSGLDRSTVDAAHHAG